MPKCSRCGATPVLALGLCAKDYYHQKHMRRQYGISWAEFDELELAQEGRCLLCRSKPDRWHVDHDHRTGKVRALLCHKCNVGLGWFDDDPEKLRRAASYLEVADLVCA